MPIHSPFLSILILFLQIFVFTDEFNQFGFLGPVECLLISYRLLMMTYFFCGANTPQNPEFSGVPMQGQTEVCPPLLGGVKQWAKRQWAETEEQEVPLEHEE